MDGAMTKAPLGWEKPGPIPLTVARAGRNAACEPFGHGVPIGLTIEGAQRHDLKLVRLTIESIVVDRPEPTEEQQQGMCLDKGYDYGEVRDTFANSAFLCAHVYGFNVLGGLFYRLVYRPPPNDKNEKCE